MMGIVLRRHKAVIHSANWSSKCFYCASFDVELANNMNDGMMLRMMITLSEN